jgi:hypothetical protein
MTTTNLAEFGYQELKEVRDLLDAMIKEGLPQDFENDGVHPMMNQNSGNVFLTNSEYQVAMMNGDKLESFYSCPQCGHEGFKDEMEHEGNKDCQEYLESIGIEKVSND